MKSEAASPLNIIEKFFDDNPVFKNEVWCSDDIPMAKESIRPVAHNRNTIDFNICKNPYIKNEIKYYFGIHLKDSLYSVITVFEGKAHHLKRMVRFIDTNYPKIKTILEVPKNELMFKYTNYLIDAGIKVKRLDKKTNGLIVTPVISLMSTFYDYIYDVFDQTPEYDKDIWEGKNLSIELNYTNTGTKRIHFTKVNLKHKELIKKYIYTRLVELQNLSFSISIRYLREISLFLNFIHNTYPSLLLKDIQRKHVEKYISYIKQKYILDKKTRKKIPATDVYISSNIGIVRKFLTDLKILDWKEAPTQHIESLFLPNDYRHRNKNKMGDNIKYIPDYIWDQVVEKINLIGDRYV